MSYGGVGICEFVAFFALALRSVVRVEPQALTSQFSSLAIQYSSFVKHCFGVG